MAPLRIDELLFAVLKEDSVSLFEYYQRETLEAIWQYVLSRESVLAYIGRSLSLPLKKALIGYMPASDWGVMVEFAVLHRDLGELDWLHENLNTRRIWTSLVQLSTRERLHKSMMTDNNSVITQWKARHGDYSDALASETICMAVLSDVIVFGDPAIFKSLHYKWPQLHISSENYSTAIKAGNFEVLQFLKYQSLSRPKFVISIDIMSLSTRLLSLIVDKIDIRSCALTTSVNLDQHKSRWLCNDQRQAVERLISLDCALARPAGMRLPGVGPYLQSLWSSEGRLSLVVTRVLDALKPNEHPLEDMPLREIKDHFASYVRSESIACISRMTAALHAISKALSRHHSSVVQHKIESLIFLLGDLEPLRGCLRGRIDLTNGRFYSIRYILQNSVLLLPKK